MLSFRHVLLIAASVAALRAEVIRVEVAKREAFANAAQPYEKLTGRFFGEIDPKHPGNAIITDIELAPRNAKGMVEYSATFTILKPVDMAKASGVLAYNVPNRGRGTIDAGNYWADFRAQGHVLVQSGWQADIRPAAGVETLTVPAALLIVPLPLPMIIWGLLNVAADPSWTVPPLMFSAPLPKTPTSSIGMLLLYSVCCVVSEALVMCVWPR